MVCIFCIAVLAIVAGALTAASVDEMEEQLADKADGEVRRVSDTESVARFELTVKVGRKDAPVAVTVYKEHSRVRIQILTHELTPEEAERLEDELAEAVGAKVVDRSSPEGEDEEPAHEHAEPEAERVAADAPEPERQREPGPEPPRG
ncbi:MAG TPA: hypothetical protein VJ653_03195 [Acidimicrobiales bacterium]|nr:hypothetical protein [Acidimicrobiales bacterium]